MSLSPAMSPGDLPWHIINWPAVSLDDLPLLIHLPDDLVYVNTSPLQIDLVTWHVIWWLLIHVTYFPISPGDWLRYVTWWPITIHHQVIISCRAWPGEMWYEVTWSTDTLHFSRQVTYNLYVIEWPLTYMSLRDLTNPLNFEDLHGCLEPARNNSHISLKLHPSLPFFLTPPLLYGSWVPFASQFHFILTISI